MELESSYLNSNLILEYLSRQTLLQLNVPDSNGRFPVLLHLRHFYCSAFLVLMFWFYPSLHPSLYSYSTLLGILILVFRPSLIIHMVSFKSLVRCSCCYLVFMFSKLLSIIILYFSFSSASFCF